MENRWKLFFFLFTIAVSIVVTVRKTQRIKYAFVSLASSEADSTRDIIFQLAISSTDGVSVQIKYGFSTIVCFIHLYNIHKATSTRRLWRSQPVQTQLLFPKVWGKSVLLNLSVYLWSDYRWSSEAPCVHQVKTGSSWRLFAWMYLYYALLEGPSPNRELSPVRKSQMNVLILNFMRAINLGLCCLS